MLLFQSSPVVASRIHALMGTAPDYERPGWLAVADHGCSYAVVVQGDGAFTVPTDAPAILRVGDALGISRGVASFDRESVKLFLRRARTVAVVSGAATLETYSAVAAVAAVERRDAVLIETTPAHEGEWSAFVRKHAPQARVVLSTPYTRAMAD